MMAAVVVFQPVWKTYLNVTDRQTDGRTTYCGTTALCVASRGKYFHPRCDNWRKIKSVNEAAQAEWIVFGSKIGVTMFYQLNKDMRLGTTVLRNNRSSCINSGARIMETYYHRRPSSAEVAPIAAHVHCAVRKSPLVQRNSIDWSSAESRRPPTKSSERAQGD